MSNLFSNVPLLISLEASLFVLLHLVGVELFSFGWRMERSGVRPKFSGEFRRRLERDPAVQPFVIPVALVVPTKTLASVSERKSSLLAVLKRPVQSATWGSELTS